MTIRRAMACATALLALFTFGAATAEEVKNKWRVELQLGGTDPGDFIRSDAANIMFLRTLNGGILPIDDPRPDDLSLGEARVDAGFRWDLRVGYGFVAWKNSELVIDVGIGGWEADIDGIEVTYSLDRDDPDYGNPFSQVFARYGDPSIFDLDSGETERWKGMRVKGGRIRVFPISANALWRFRPTKRFNPYIGMGVGYLFVEFEPTPDWLAIADQLDASCVSYTSMRFGWERRQLNLAVADPVEDRSLLEGDDACILRTDGGLWQSYGFDLKRPKIHTPDTFFLEMRGGMEWQWKPKIAFFVDVDFSWADEEIFVTVDERTQFGEGVEPGLFEESDAPSPAGGTPAYIGYGGLVVAAGNEGVVEAQPGEYIITGGRLDYGGWNFAAGVRFTLN